MGNALDFYMLTLYPETLLNSHISFSGCFEDSLGVSTSTIMSSVSKDVVTSYLYAFYFLISHNYNV